MIDPDYTELDRLVRCRVPEMLADLEKAGLREQRELVHTLVWEASRLQWIARTQLEERFGKPYSRILLRELRENP